MATWTEVVFIEASNSPNRWGTQKVIARIRHCHPVQCTLLLAARGPKFIVITHEQAFIAIFLKLKSRSTTLSVFSNNGCMCKIVCMTKLTIYSSLNQSKDSRSVEMSLLLCHWLKFHCIAILSYTDTTEQTKMVSAKVFQQGPLQPHHKGRLLWMSPNGYPVDKNLQPAMMARSNKKRLNDDDESFGKSNKQPVLSVAAPPPPLPPPLPFAPWYSCCQTPDDGGRMAAAVRRRWWRLLGRVTPLPGLGWTGG